MEKKYTELSKAKVQGSRNIVISRVENKDGTSYTMAQQLEVMESKNRRTAVFMRGAVIVDGIEGLIALRDALNVAIQKES